VIPPAKLNQYCCQPLNLFYILLIIWLKCPHEVRLEVTIPRPCLRKTRTWVVWSIFNICTSCIKHAIITTLIRGIWWFQCPDMHWTCRHEGEAHDQEKHKFPSIRQSIMFLNFKRSITFEIWLNVYLHLITHCHVMFLF